MNTPAWQRNGTGAFAAGVGRWLEGVKNTALDLLYPRTCAVCGGPRPDSPLAHVCPACAVRLTRLEPPYCGICGEWFVGQIDGTFRCANCADRRFDFDFAFAPMRAEESMRELIHRYKYERALWLRVPLGQLLAAALAGESAEPRLRTEREWVAVPVPLHPRRLREREFNQAAELCRVLSKITGVTICDALARTRYTTVQATLHRQQRLDNLRGAFALKPGAQRSHSLLGKAVLLVDDVFTTGATAQECASVLRREAGARRVAVLTVARG